MKRLLIVTALALVTLCGQFALAEDLKLTTSGASTVLVVGSGGSVTYSNANFGGWDIKIVFGDSNSPSLYPYGLDLSSVTATCSNTPCTKNPLDIYLSDTGFTEKTNVFVNDYSATDTGKGSTTQYAWDDTGNAMFGEGTPIGIVGPFNGSGVFSALAKGGGPAGPGAYSLTIEDIFTSPNKLGAGFSSDGDITAVTPEPVSMLLMGTFLSLAGGLLGKKKRA